jgi:hypothetical protein
MKLTGENRSTREKPCPSATLSTTNLTWTDPGSNPGLRGERPANNRPEPWHGPIPHISWSPKIPTLLGIGLLQILSPLSLISLISFAATKLSLHLVR